MPSSSAARCHSLAGGLAVPGAGAVSARNCSTAATIAAASDSEATGETSSIRGLGGRRLPLVATAGTVDDAWPAPTAN
jgi:hypothetical protein